MSENGKRERPEGISDLVHFDQLALSHLVLETEPNTIAWILMHSPPDIGALFISSLTGEKRKEVQRNLAKVSETLHETRFYEAIETVLQIVETLMDRGLILYHEGTWRGSPPQNSKTEDQPAGA